MHSKLIRVDVYQSAITLYIFRMGRYVPIRSQNPNKPHIKIQLLIRIGLFQPVWPVLLPVWPPLNRSQGAGLPGDIISSSGLQIGRSIYAFRLSRWDICNGEVQFTIWLTCLDRSDWFIQHLWPVYPDCPANLLYANFVCQQRQTTGMHELTPPRKFACKMRPVHQCVFGSWEN